MNGQYDAILSLKGHVETANEQNCYNATRNQLSHKNQQFLLSIFTCMLYIHMKDKQAIFFVKNELFLFYKSQYWTRKQENGAPLNCNQCLKISI